MNSHAYISSGHPKAAALHPLQSTPPSTVLTSRQSFVLFLEIL